MAFLLARTQAMDCEVEPTLDELFDSGRDLDLCNRLAALIAEQHHDEVRLPALTAAERIVFLVWSTFGIIGNGGFRYLFEHQWEDDPYFAHAAHAYEVIGCREAAEAFQDALDLFPKGRPPANVAKRLKWYLTRISGWPAPNDWRFLNANDDIVRCLSSYVRRHRSAFSHLG